MDMKSSRLRWVGSNEYVLVFLTAKLPNVLIKRNRDCT